MSSFSPKSVKRYSFLLTVLVAIFFFNMLVSAASESSEKEILITKHPYAVTMISENSRIREFNELYTSLINDKDLETHTIMFNGSLINMIELPLDSIAVQVPNDQIAIKYSDENENRLIGWSSDLFEDE